MTPLRLRLSRAKGFDLQAMSIATNGLSAVNVARPSKWGNPFIVGKDGTRSECVDFYITMLTRGYFIALSPSVEKQREIRHYVSDNLASLRGKNLACWCALDGKPCHADVLLTAASRMTCDEVGG
ncbi:DUF4326 domain-containing protein [Pararhizobium sp. DWP3-4]|uniref:DUF4326 domain-containing protein n=1 Tax=Pararhizobium sp. DWP3-4 TaxID=2804565 RepID=UPI003CEE0501